MFSPLLPADGEGNKEQSLFIANIRNAKTAFLELHGFYMYPPHPSSVGSPPRLGSSAEKGQVPPELPTPAVTVTALLCPSCLCQYIEITLLRPQSRTVCQVVVFKRWQPRRKPILQTLPEPALRPGPCKTSQPVKPLAAFCPGWSTKLRRTTCSWHRDAAGSCSPSHHVAGLPV